MTHYLRLCFVGIGIAMIGCAAQPRIQTVSTAQWQSVPASERQQVDKSYGDTLTAAQREEERAKAELATVQQQHDAAAVAPSDAAPADADADAVAAWRANHEARVAAFA